MDWLKEVFTEQVKLQETVKGVSVDSELPNVKDMYGAATGMIIEIGEMLQCDTRWKKELTGSNKKQVYDKAQFVEELSDVFIYLMNVLIYGDVNLDFFKNSVIRKQNIVKERFNQ